MYSFLILFALFMGGEISSPLFADSSKSTEKTTEKNPSKDLSDEITHDLGEKRVWFDEDGKLSPCGHKAIKFIESAPKHGLSLKPFEKILHIQEGTSTSEAEKRMNSAVSLFIQEMLGGKDRTSYAKKHSALVHKVDVPELLKKGILDQKDCKNLKHFMPKAPGYKALQKALKKYQELLKKAKKEKDPAFTLKQKLKKGDKGKDVEAIKRYLIFYGYMKESDGTGDFFDDALDESIKRFQLHHNEESDGVIGPQTKHLFERTVEDHLNLIRLNLQRWRYLDHPLPDRYILVNVAGYRVEAVKDHKIELSMRAVVGMKSRKTPLFKAPMTQFIFNPTWTVPDGIFYKDKLPRILNDPDYLDRIGAFMRGSDGMPVNVYEVDWSDTFNRPRVTYPPGRSNPLGQIKFHIQNRFTIYLHDTDQKEYLKKNKRARSSGCVRLEKPRELVNWIDAGGAYGTPESLEKPLSTRTTSWHTMKEAIPVYFVYFTTWVDDDGNVCFSDDPYAYDPEELSKFKHEEQRLGDIGENDDASDDDGGEEKA